MVLDSGPADENILNENAADFGYPAPAFRLIGRILLRLFFLKRLLGFLLPSFLPVPCENPLPDQD